MPTLRRRKVWIALAILVVIAALPFLGRGAKRPVTRRIERYRDRSGHEFERLGHRRGEHEDLVILAFSGGGTRAAAFSYGVLEALRKIELTERDGSKMRLLDEVDVVTGVSGGSFTALAYGLYGEKLFDTYEDAFLKRNIQGELVRRVIDPRNWRALASKGWGRSELAADLYDQLLFHGATFADLEKTGGPTVVVGATDLSTGSRLVFAPQNFDVMCAELSDFRLARAAAASAAVPVVLSALTIDNYGGSCGYQPPEWLRPFLEAPKPPRPAGRVMRRIRELKAIDENVKDRYMHLVDGGLADNLGLRGVLNVVETFEALRITGQPTPLDHMRRLIVFVVNSVSTPKFDWNEREDPPRDFNALAKVAGVPIDRYANESVELLKDVDARWAMLRELHVGSAPNVEIYPIEVSFQAIKADAERERLNQIPTSFHLPAESIDRLRAAAASIVFESPELREALKDEWTGP